MAAEGDNDYFAPYRKANFSQASGMRECFDHFDSDGDGLLDAEEFGKLCASLFIRNHGGRYQLTEEQVIDLIEQLDENKDGKISLQEFKACWRYWFKQILSPVSALIIIDVQNDFISGSLALKHCPSGQDAEEVVPVINKLLDEVNFDVVVYTRDWHPADHISFAENAKHREMDHSSLVSSEDAKLFDVVRFAGPPVTEQKLWPTHCVQNSVGAEYHKDLKIVDNSFNISKGSHSNIDSYSAFWDNMKLSQTPLAKELGKRNVTDVYLCGLAFDICVSFTSIDAAEHGFRTTVIEDACRSVDCTDALKMKNKMKEAGCVIVNSQHVIPDMVNVNDRRPDLGYQAAINVAVAKKIINA
ncbi:nicotinamidase-like [Saccoglossus kowalevskii]